jgi:hypothetical protein
MLVFELAVSIGLDLNVFFNETICLEAVILIVKGSII